MDQSVSVHPEDEDNPIMKTVKGATMGLAAGAVLGTVVATLYDVPPVEGNVASPGLRRTLKVCGSYGLTFAALGGIYVGVEQLMEKQRMKKDWVNGAVGAFAAGAAVFGFKARRFSSAIAAGSALAATSTMLDIGINTTKADTGKDYYAYATDKKSSAS